MKFATSASALVLLLCVQIPFSRQQALLTEAAPKGIIPLPDEPAPAAAAAAPAAAVPTLPTAGAAAALPAAAVPAALPAAGAAPAAVGVPGATAAAAPALPIPTLPGAALPGNFAPAAAPGGVLPGAVGAAAFPGALTAPAISVGLPAAGVPGAFPGAVPGAGMPLMPAGAFPMAAGIPGRAAPPPPRARSAAPPAPPIPVGGKWTPQWDELKDLGVGDLVVSMNTANTPEQIYWNQKGLREAVAKTAQVRSSNVYYKDVLPNIDETNQMITTARFVLTGKNPDTASTTQANLGEAGETTLKNKVEEFGLEIIGDTLKAQTPEDFKATANSALGPLPSSMTMDTSGGMNGVGPGGAGGPLGPNSMDTGVAPGAMPGTAGLPAGNATGAAGALPGAAPGPLGGAGGTSALAARRAQISGSFSAVPAGLTLVLAVAGAVALL